MRGLFEPMLIDSFATRQRFNPQTSGKRHRQRASFLRALPNHHRDPHTYITSRLRSPGSRFDGPDKKFAPKVGGRSFAFTTAGAVSLITDSKPNFRHFEQIGIEGWCTFAKTESRTEVESQLKSSASRHLKPLFGSGLSLWWGKFLFLDKEVLLPPSSYRIWRLR